jgi:hypothetical protein
LKKFTSPRSGGGFFRTIGRCVTVLAMVAVFQACEEPDEIGLDLIDWKAGVMSSDTMRIQSVTIIGDSVPTSFGSQGMLGFVNDPVFGKMRASIFTQVRLSHPGLDLGTNPVLDSIQLRLAYSGRYVGDSTAQLALNVYEISEAFPTGDTLYTNFRLNHNVARLARHEFTPAPRDTVMVDTIPYPAHITIRLSNALGNRFINANGTASFENATNFTEFFKGLYLVVDDDIEGEGMIFNINLLSTLSSMRLFYHNDDQEEQRVSDFPINEFARRSTYVEHYAFEQAHPLLKAQALEGNPESGDSLLFVQPLGGVSATVKIPGLVELGNIPNIAISKARLVVPVAAEFSSLSFPEPPRLLLYRLDENGRSLALYDMFLGDNYFDGYFDSVEKAYRINITHYIQQVINGRLPNDGLVLAVAGASERANRVVLNGPGVAQKPMRLEVVYTVFN